MDLATLAHLSGVPFLGAAATLLKSTYNGIANVKLYNQQCVDMSARCLGLMVSLRDSSHGLEGSKVIEIADETEAIIICVSRKVNEWGSWNHLKSFLSQSEIKDGIDRLHRDIDSAMMKFNIQINMKMTRGQLESKATQIRDKAEIRELLHYIVQSTEDMKALINMQGSRGSRPVEVMMESLQTELLDSSLEKNEGEVFKTGLWELHQKTSTLPPLTDLSGQVTLSSQNTVAKGSFNDIFLGEWLDREPVALRLPRSLASNPDVQHRFQREVSIWRELHDPNVVPLFGVIYIGDDLYSVSPWMDNGTAISYVKKFPTVDRLKILTEAASGLDYLHGRGIVHGDLRGGNVLISKDGTALLSDFGLSKFLEDCGGMTTSNSVNPRWFAPELLQQNGHVSTHSDVWSFGMVCLEILSGDAPFSNIQRDIAVMRELDMGKLPKHPGRIATAQGLSDDMWALLQKCWQKKPELRPSISDIKKSIMEIRGLFSTTDTRVPLSKRLSRFSIRRNVGSRPSTSSSDTSNISSISYTHRARNHIFASNSNDEDDELSPIGVNNGILTSETVNIYNQQASTSRPVLNSSGQSLMFSSSPHQPRATSLFHSNGGNLEIPLLSSSLPNQFGLHFPVEQSVSYDGAKSLALNKSVTSSDTGTHLTGDIREAVTDPRIIVNTNESGTVISGTLEGLVQRLITNFNSRKDIEYRDALLTACADFTTPEDLFGMLSRRFYDVERDTNIHPEDRVALQFNIFMVVMHWLSNRHLSVDHQLLWQMKTFCDLAIRLKSSTTMSDKARDLLHLIDNRANEIPSSPLSPGRKMLKASEIRPQGLAIALSLLEGDQYKNLVPSDYIAHLRRHPGYNNVQGAYTINNQILFWVKESILHYDRVDQRADVLKFFIHTAQECRKLRNFSSLAAIASALHSAPIERLRLTKSALTLPMQGKLEALEEIINPTANHHGYRNALNDVSTAEERDHCIPWLAIHLKELHAVLQNYPTTVRVDGRPLINFQRYLKFMDRIKEVVYYKPPGLEHYRNHGYREYLENQLRNLKMTPDSTDELMARSQSLEAKEILDYIRKFTLYLFAFSRFLTCETP